MDNATPQPTTCDDQQAFEGMLVSTVEGTLQAINVILDADISMGDEIDIHVRAKVIEIRYGLDKDRGGYGDTGRRKHVLVPVQVKIER